MLFLCNISVQLLCWKQGSSVCPRVCYNRSKQLVVIPSTRPICLPCRETTPFAVWTIQKGRKPIYSPVLYLTHLMAAHMSGKDDHPLFPTLSSQNILKKSSAPMERHLRIGSPLQNLWFGWRETQQITRIGTQAILAIDSWKKRVAVQAGWADLVASLRSWVRNWMIRSGWRRWVAAWRNLKVGQRRNRRRRLHYVKSSADVLGVFIQGYGISNIDFCHSIQWQIFLNFNAVY